MRVLLLSPHYPPEVRSVSVLMSQLAEDLASAGHDVTVLTPYPPTNMAEAEPSAAIRVLDDRTYFAGLRKAGMPEQ